MARDRRHACSRVMPRAALMVSGAAIALLLAPPSGAVQDPDPAASGGVNDPMTVEVPYLAETQVTINSAWTLAACPQTPADAFITVVCDDEGGGIVVSTDSYDPEEGPWPFPVDVTTVSGAARTLDYTLALGAPEPPTPLSGRFQFPGLAGGRTLIPFESLIEDCTYCAEGAGIHVEAVPPEDGPMLVRAWVAERHVVIDAAPSAAEAVIEITLEDEAGGVSQPTELTVPLVGFTSGNPTGLHLIVPRSDVVEIAAADLVVDRDGGEWNIIGCSPPARGILRCSTDTVEFTRSESTEALDDQASIVLMAADGRSVTASITVSDDADDPRLAGAVPTEHALVPIATREPIAHVTGDAGADTGILTALWSTIPPLN